MRLLVDVCCGVWLNAAEADDCCHAISTIGQFYSRARFMIPTRPGMHFDVDDNGRCSRVCIPGGERDGRRTRAGARGPCWCDDVRDLCGLCSRIGWSARDKLLNCHQLQAGQCSLYGSDDELSHVVSADSSIRARRTYVTICLCDSRSVR